MKCTLEVECTPLEARQFFGLPDLQQPTNSKVEDCAKTEAQRQRAILMGISWLPGSLPCLGPLQEILTQCCNWALA